MEYSKYDLNLTTGNSFLAMFRRNQKYGRIRSLITEWWRTTLPRDLANVPPHAKKSRLAELRYSYLDEINHWINVSFTCEFSCK